MPHESDSILFFKVSNVYYTSITTFDGNVRLIYRNFRDHFASWNVYPESIVITSSPSVLTKVGYMLRLWFQRFCKLQWLHYDVDKYVVHCHTCVTAKLAKIGTLLHS